MLMPTREENHEDEKKIASMRLLNAIQAKIREWPQGEMYIETIIGGITLQL